MKKTITIVLLVFATCITQAQQTNSGQGNQITTQNSNTVTTNTVSSNTINTTTSYAHLSINGAPTGFLTAWGPAKSSYLGVTLLPELEFSYDVSGLGAENSSGKIALSFYWTGVNALIASSKTNSSKDTVPTPAIAASKTGQSNWAWGIGYEFNLKNSFSAGSSSTANVPLLSGFSIQIGSSNLNFGTSEKANFQRSFIVMIGFKVNVFSFDLHL